MLTAVAVINATNENSTSPKTVFAGGMIIARPKHLTSECVINLTDVVWSSKLL